MKVLVAVKRVIDHNVRVRALPDGSGVDAAGVKMSMNPFDENAVEAALRLREDGVAAEVVAVSIGASSAQDVLRHALAMGVDRAVLVDCDPSRATLSPLSVARLLRAVTLRENPGLVLLGKQAIDDDAGQTPQMLAALLDWPQATFASALSVRGAQACVTREIDGGTEAVELDLPAVVSADLRLNAPRFVKLPNLMQAKKKPIETLSPDSLGVAVKTHLTPLRVDDALPRKPGVRVASVAELIARLREEAGVLA